MRRVVPWLGLAFAACGPAVSNDPSGGATSGKDATAGAPPEADPTTDGVGSDADTLESSGDDPAPPMTSSGSGSDDTTGTTTSTVDACESFRPGDCSGVPLRDVSAVIEANTFGGEDVPLEFNPSRGSVACWDVAPGGGTQVEVFLGPFEICEPQTRLTLTVYDGARVYDLETDPGPPGMVEPGLIRFAALYSPTVGVHYGYDTINQAGFGTLDVRALPTGEVVQFEFDAAGTIASADGWVFDLHFEANGG